MLSCLALTLGMNLATYHLDRTQDFREINPGVYALCESPSGENLILGAYLNSINRPSVHAGIVRHWVGLDWELGLVSGYRKPLLPLVAPSYKFTSGARLTFLPPIDKHGGAVHLSWEW